GVAHDERRLRRVEDDDRLAAIRAAYGLDGAGRGLGAFVDVGPCPWAGRPRGDRRDALRVRDRGYIRDRADDRHRGLATAGHHVDLAGVAVRVEVDRRHDERTERGRGQVDNPDVVWRQYRGIGRVRCR